MDHQVVARLAGNRQGASGHLRGWIDRAHVGVQQAGAALCFVHGGDAELTEGTDHVGIGAGNGANDCGFQFGLRSLGSRLSA